MVVVAVFGLIKLPHFPLPKKIVKKVAKPLAIRKPLVYAFGTARE